MTCRLLARSDIDVTREVVKATRGENIGGQILLWNTKNLFRLLLGVLTMDGYLKVFK